LPVVASQARHAGVEQFGSTNHGILMHSLQLWFPGVEFQ
jgi:hypothetical protein